MTAKGQYRTPNGLAVVAILAIAQGAFGLLRAAQWIQIGSDLSQQGVLLLPIIGAIAYARAGVVAIVAALYGLFAWGALKRRGWAWSLGIAIALANVIWVALALLVGESPVRALPWALVPVILVGYLLASAGRRALGPGRA